MNFKKLLRYSLRSEHRQKLYLSDFGSKPKSEQALSAKLPEMTNELVFLIVGLIIGASSVWMMLKGKQRSASGDVPREMYQNTKTQLDETLAKLEKKYRETEELVRDLANSEKTVENYHDRLKNQQSEIEQLQERFRVSFENVANRLFEEKSAKFTEQNQINIQKVLAPLSEKITGFEQKIQQAHIEDTKQRSGLLEQIRALGDLNKQMTEDTRNLTRALKGESKVQGNWGEMVLEKVLEKSGLTKGREYETQQHLVADDMQRRLPDVILHLPDNKHIIIDSKVSLTAFERYVTSTTENPAGDPALLREHIASMRTHIKQLSEKNYPALKGINSPDFVLLFVPLEPAFSVAMQHDNELFSEAFERNIVIVTPTTLLATARTIASLWRQEYQNRNALEIARVGGDLYDKFVGFLNDMKIIGERINQSQQAYDNALNKLHTGKGSLSRRAEKLRELGTKTSKQIPRHLLDDAEDPEPDTETELLPAAVNPTEPDDDQEN